jgi:hypothetical protein
MTTTALATPAWIMAGRLRNLPGVLAAGEGTLAFVGDDGPLFRVPLADVTGVAWPWHWFGGGCVLTAAGARYKITFVRPNGAPDVAPSLVDASVALLSALAGAGVPAHPLQGLFDVRTGRRAAAMWKQVLPA